MPIAIGEMISGHATSPIETDQNAVVVMTGRLNSRTQEMEYEPFVFRRYDNHHRDGGPPGYYGVDPANSRGSTRERIDPHQSMEDIRIGREWQSPVGMTRHPVLYVAKPRMSWGYRDDVPQVHTQSPTAYWFQQTS